MTKADKEELLRLSELSEEAVDIINSICQSLEDMGRKRDTTKATRAKDILWELKEHWENII